MVQQLERQAREIDTTACVCISTIQRMYSMLKGRELLEQDGKRFPLSFNILHRIAPV